METLPPLVTQPPVHQACAYWSEWINENQPNTKGSVKGGVKGGAGNRGDIEKVMLLKLQREYNFCSDVRKAIFSFPNLVCVDLMT